MLLSAEVWTVRVVVTFLIFAGRAHYKLSNNMIELAVGNSTVLKIQIIYRRRETQHRRVPAQSEDTRLWPSLLSINVYNVYSGTPKALSWAHYGQGSGPILLDEVQCSGNELSLDQCKKSDWGQQNCDHIEDAGVSCDPFTGTYVQLCQSDVVDLTPTWLALLSR